MAVVTTVYCNVIRSDPLSSPLAHIDPSGLDLLQADSLTLSFSIMFQNSRAMYNVVRHAVVVALLKMFKRENVFLKCSISSAMPIATSHKVNDSSW